MTYWNVAYQWELRCSLSLKIYLTKLFTFGYVTITMIKIKKVTKNRLKKNLSFSWYLSNCINNLII